MKIKDIIYGEEEINEAILIELINSSTLQRLKDISQLGMPQEYHHKKTFSRYEHCIGVLILLRRLGANVEEQIAGLLHDISHPPFSHLFDWVLEDPTQKQISEEYQDKMLPTILKESDIPQILEKYGVDEGKVVNLNNYSLLEQPTPGLCADRIDYAMREIINFEDQKVVETILNNLVNKGGKIFFKHKIPAESFALGFMKCQTEHWGETMSKARWYFFASILKKAIERKIISLEDFRKTDHYIISLLKESGDKELLQGLKMLEGNLKIKETEEAEGFVVNKKFRHVDPEILIGTESFPLSKISKKYKALLEKEKQNSLQPKRIIIIQD